MQVTVTIPNDFIEEDSLVDAVKQSIIQEVIFSVKKTAKEQIEKEIATIVRSSIDAVVKEEADKVKAEFAETGLILVSGQMIPVKDHLQSIFRSHSGWNSPTDQVKALADKWAKELKAKYDGAFVTQLVHRIDLAGLLKPEVAKLLLSDPTPPA